MQQCCTRVTMPHACGTCPLLQFAWTLLAVDAVLIVIFVVVDFFFPVLNRKWDQRVVGIYQVLRIISSPFVPSAAAAAIGSIALLVRILLLQQ